MKAQILWEDDGELLLMDAVPQEGHRLSAQTTDQEVEKGVDLSDHVKKDPRVLTCQVVIASAPLVPDENDASETRVKDEWTKLLGVRDRARLATITTEIETYRNMVLIEATAQRTAADAEWLKVDLTFKQVRFVSTQTVADRVPVRPRDHAQVDRGAQGTQPAPASARRSVQLSAMQHLAGWGLGATGL